jgi:hypothetical protein
MGAGMRVAEIEEMMSDDPGGTEAFLAELISTSNVDELSEIARTARVEALKLRAIEGLGEVGGAEATAALAEMLEGANTPFLEGGTEQRREHEARLARLVGSLSRAGGRQAPTGRSQEDIQEFIEAFRER